MKVLGISGSLNLIHQPPDGDKHAAAAVLLVDGKVTIRSSIMKPRKGLCITSLLLILVCWLMLIQPVFPLSLPAEETKKTFSGAEMEGIRELMENGKIPGLGLVIINGSEPAIIKGFGYADPDKKIPVTETTLFELASCSKAFTALAVLQLEEKGLLRLDDTISQYFPWFWAKYRDKEYKITLRQLLHHTSGVPWKTIDVIPRGREKDAMEQTLRRLVGIELANIPGNQFQYASVNYDIIGAVIERVSGQPFETYMRDQVFVPLGMMHTTVGTASDPSQLATGHKISFFAPRQYQPPVFRGNYPAGYVISSPRDVARWLKIQMGMVETPFQSLIRTTQQRDSTVPPQPETVSSYAMGWNVSLKGDGEIVHAGLNPNFVCFLGFRPEKKLAVAVLANSNSKYLNSIYEYVMNHLADETGKPIHPTQDKIDLLGSIASLVLGLFVLITLVLTLLKVIDIFKGKSKFAGYNWKKLGRLLGAISACVPFLLGIYLLPTAALNLSWATVIVWGPFSIYTTLLLMIATFIMGYIKFFLSQLFPNRNKYLNVIPTIALLAILTGFANTAVLFLITTSFYSPIGLGYLLFYFALAYSMFALGTKLVTTKMINMTNNITLDLRIDLINKILAARYQSFEKLKVGRVFTTLNTDTAVLANSAALFVGAITNSITAISAFIYLMTISFESTLVVILVVFMMVGYYYMISKKARVFLEEARDTQNVYMSLLNSLIKGFKELSLRFGKKKGYRADLLQSCQKFCSASINAAVKFLNANIIGNSFIMIILGVLSIVVPRVLMDVKTITLISFIMVLLYLIGPINGILTVIPGLTAIKVSWDRIKGFSRDLELQINEESATHLIKRLDTPVNRENPPDRLSSDITETRQVESIKAEGLIFEYDSQHSSERFTLGPIDLEIKKGEALFIIGGNGSGKTTLAKIITGLYMPKAGVLKINDQVITDSHLGEHYSTIFSDYHLFQKIYEVDTEKKKTEIQHFLEMLELEHKVAVKGNAYTTLQLSSGQKKRLALMQCFLEDSPIYLFDEFAANQDPEFRRFFYRELLEDLKNQGKIIIAVTHDDHYFDVADKIIKLDLGKLDMNGVYQEITRVVNEKKMGI